MGEVVLRRWGIPGLGRSFDPTLFLCLVGVVLPNAISLGALIAGIGLPPRPAMIVMYAAIVIMARHVPALVTVALYVIAAIYDAISTLALQFNLAPTDIGLAVHLGGELNLLRSPFYIFLLVSSIGLAALTLALILYRGDLLVRGNPFIMAGFALFFAGADLLANTSPHYQFGTLFAQGQPFDSAVVETKLRESIAAHPKRNVMLVVVEALGEFEDPALQKLFFDALRPAEGRYTITSGTTSYFGSTTAAEMRELCSTRESYHAFMERSDIVCLPKQLSEKGFRTISLHHFAARFFDREQWYPKVGFERRIFREDLVGVPFRSCGGPFRGPCDVDMIPVIAKEFRDAEEPTFLYWLTLSTHVPIAPKEGTPRLACEKDGGKVGQKEVCFMTEMWIDVLEGIAKMATEVPPMEIVIVGDHAPPLWSKTARNLFAPGKVPWFHLVPKDNQARGRRVRAG